MTDPSQQKIESSQPISYTSGMKVAVSIPESVFKEAEKLAKKKKTSRSKLYSLALREYLARHSEDQITESINRALAEIGDQTDPFVEAAADEILRNTEW
jgi:metal-responsive CopG/Arc/MetJ family transcriptional regulator